MPQPVTVVSARFEDLTSIGLRKLIAEDPNLRLVASDIDLDRLEDVLDEHKPSVVLLNYGSLPNAAYVYQLHQHSPDTHIVVLANAPTATEANQLLSFGATACVSKETQGRDIINAMHLASRGMHVIPRTAPAGSSRFERLELPQPDLLTRRETEVLDLLQRGMTNAQIAHELSIGTETVRTHARNIYRKLGVSTRRDLAQIANAQAQA